MGYQTIVEPVNGRAVINVVSAEEAIALDAVVAIGYGSVRKRDLTTAVSTVSTEDMKLRPVKELKGFKKIALEPGQKQTVTFEITPDILKFFDAEKHDWVLEKGKFTAFIGSASDDIRTQVEFEVI